MPVWMLVLIIAGGVVSNIVMVFGLIYWITRATLHRVAGPYPEASPAADAVDLSVRRIMVGGSRLGGLTRVSVDERFLHVRPVPVMARRGVVGFSIPWDAFEGPAFRVPVQTPAMLMATTGDGIRIGGPPEMFELLQDSQHDSRQDIQED